AAMNRRFWPRAVVMMLIATLTAVLVTNSGRAAWFVGVLVLMVYVIFAMTLYLLPPRAAEHTSAAGVQRHDAGRVSRDGQGPHPRRRRRLRHRDFPNDRACRRFWRGRIRAR